MILSGISTLCFMTDFSPPRNCYLRFDGEHGKFCLQDFVNRLHTLIGLLIATSIPLSSLLTSHKKNSYSIRITSSSAQLPHSQNILYTDTLPYPPVGTLNSLAMFSKRVQRLVFVHTSEVNWKQSLVQLLAVSCE